jgi:hypothetical protein
LSKASQKVKKPKKPKKQNRRPEPQQENAAVDPGNKRRFDQLLDDAIFGVKSRSK